MGFVEHHGTVSRNSSSQGLRRGSFSTVQYSCHRSSSRGDIYILVTQSFAKK